MTCMKCGREIPAGQVFCDSCLEVMEKYPIKPDTVVQLPRRSTQPVQKKQPSRRKQLTPEEQVPLLKRTCRRLMLCVIALLLILSATAVVIVLHLQGHSVELPKLPGYHNTTPSDSTNPARPDGMFHVKHS